MSFHKWSGLESGFTHEHVQIQELTKVLQQWSEEKNNSIHLLTNFYIRGEEIDAAIILSNNVIVVDLKSGSGNITGGENGDWLCSQSDDQQFIINENRKNPYLQARDKRYAVINYLDGRKSEIFSAQKADQMDFYHTSSLIVFDGKIEWNKEQLPVKVLPWFDVLSIDSITEKLESIRSNAISLSQEESWLIPTLLNLNNEDEFISETVEGIAAESIQELTHASTSIEPEIPAIKSDIDIRSGEESVETYIKNEISNEKIVSGIFIGIEDDSIIIK